MKKILVLCLFLLFMTSPILAQELKWDNNDPGNVTGYIMYFSDDPGIPDKYHKTIAGESNTSVTFADLQLAFGVQYEFYVTAYNDNGESGQSNHVTGVRQAYVPPTDNLPTASSGPLDPNNLNTQ